MPSADEEAEKPELLHFVGGHANWQSPFGKQFGSFL